ncbi:MAG TPA: PilZ domain-containing protein [Desulfobacterales bacterium]
MKNYENGGLCFESEASITPGTIVLIGNEDQRPGAELRAGVSKTLTCRRVKIHDCRQRNSAECRFGFDVERIAGSRDNLSESPCSDAESTESSGSKSNLRERRRHSRRLYYRFVYFLCDEKYYEGVTKDISSGGLFIRTRGKLQVGMLLSLTLPKNPFEKERTIEAEVVRVEPGGIGVKIRTILKTAAARR